MKQRTISAATIILLSMIFLLTGCAKAPQQEIDVAKKAVEDAQAAKAERYASAQFNAAKDTLETALAVIKTQDDKTFLRDYGRALSLLRSVIDGATLARKAALSNPEKIKEEATDLVNGAEATLKELKIMFKENSNKIKKHSLKRLEADIKLSEEMLKAAKVNMENDFTTAGIKAKSVIEKVGAAKERLIKLTNPQRVDSKKRTSNESL